MSTKSTLQNHKTLLMLFFFLITLIGNAQIGIGTTTPDATSMVDITSTTKGMLAPRMTTIQRNAITSPADGLLVYDTDLKSFYYFSTPSGWLPLLNSLVGRTNFKRIKSAADLAQELIDGGNTKYKLNSTTLYEINGTITLSFPIDLNNAYLQGLDSKNDIIKRTGNIFEGATGGTIKGLTLTATGATSNVFNLNGSATQNLIFRDCVVTGSGNVGSISNYGLVFCSIIQFATNANGITYNNITQLLLSNLGWFGDNTGTFEKLTGTFTLVQKQGGFSQVNTSAIGFDVSANPAITGDAVLESVVFTGSNTTGYVKPYTTGTYTGYNFNNSWNVRCAGIPTESDANAVGDFAIDYPAGGGVNTTLTNTTATKVLGNSTSYNLFRFANDAIPNNNNRLRYMGKKKRIFQVSGSVSFQVSNNSIYVIYIAKNGVPLTQYKIYGKGNIPLLATSDIVVLPINASVELSNNDQIEVYAQRNSGTGTDVIVVPNATIIIK